MIFLVWSFRLVVIGFPFFEKSSIAWVILLVIAISSLLYVYFKENSQRIWLFISGYILLRLVYAVFFIPFQRKGIESYNEHLSQVVKKTGKNDILYLADAPDFPVAINAKYFTYQTEIIKKPHTLPLEIPYYFYRNTGKIIRFDTTRGNAKYFISYERQLHGDIDTLYSFVDRNVGERVVFYQFKTDSLEK